MGGKQAALQLSGAARAFVQREQGRYQFIRAKFTEVEQLPGLGGIHVNAVGAQRLFPGQVVEAYTVGRLLTGQVYDLGGQRARLAEGDDARSWPAVGAL